MIRTIEGFANRIRMPRLVMAPVPARALSVKVGKKHISDRYGQS